MGYHGNGRKKGILITRGEGELTKGTLVKEFFSERRLRNRVSGGPFEV